MNDRSRSWMRVVGAVLSGALLTVACAPPPRVEPLLLPENSIKFHAGYNEAFDRILQTLREDGYEIAVADRAAGIIETRPKALVREETKGGPFEYSTFFSIMVRGGWRDSWAVVNLLVLPSYPKEREKVIKQLEERLRSRSE